MTPPHRWRKSSYSDQVNCVELAWPPAGAALRDSKNPTPTLHFPRPHLASFVKAVTRDPIGP
jgi:Domain of unknown function (DUF397)